MRQSSRWILVGLFLLALPAGRRVQAGVIRKGPSSCGGVALTFDLCPVAHGVGYDEALVHLLVEHHIHATFFPSGRWIDRHDAAMRQLLAVPYFEIGTHGQAHLSLPGLSPDAQRQEIVAPVSELATRYGRSSTLFRPPYGDFTPETVALAEAAGLKFVLWSVVSGDADPKLAADRIAHEVESRVRSGSIVIFHANGHGWHTREVMEDVYREVIVRRGLAPLTVTELLAGCADRVQPTRH